MKHFLIISLACFAFFASLTSAQEADRGVLQKFLEDNLSTVGREVRIEGFSGALSGRAEVAKLTIADREGVWITIENAVFDWNRAQLLRGILDVKELSASQIEIARKPIAETAAPSPETSSFSLPDLPVSIQIGNLSVPKVVLGETILGQALVFSANGRAGLANGEGDAMFTLSRLDGPKGALSVSGGYANETRQLALSLELNEAEKGIVSQLLGFPGAPSVALTLEGDGPMSEFAADLSLATDGVQRLSGRVSIAEPNQGKPEIARQFQADIQGDLRPLLLPEYHAFLGDDLRLKTEGTQYSDGRLLLQEISLTAQSIQLSGSLALGADGWPDHMALSGSVGTIDGAPVVLAIPGEPTALQSAEIAFGYDSAQGEFWDLEASLKGVKRDEIAFENLVIAGAGSLNASTQTVDGTLQAAVVGMVQNSDTLTQAVGQHLSADLAFDWTKNAPLRLNEVMVSGEDYSLTGAIAIDGVDGQIDLAVGLDVTAVVQDLARFSGLLDQELAGAATLSLRGGITPVSGGFDLRVTGETNGLKIFIAQVDPIIEGKMRLSLNAERNAQGLEFSAFSLESQAAKISGGATLSTGQSAASVVAVIDDLGFAVAGAQGPASFNAKLLEQAETWEVLSEMTAPGGLTGRLAAQTRVQDGKLSKTTGELSMTIEDISRYSEVANRPIAGALTLRASGEGHVTKKRFRALISLEGQELSIGQAETDRLLAGGLRFEAALSGNETGDFSFEKLRLQTNQLEASLQGAFGAENVALRYNMELGNLGAIVPGLVGAAQLRGGLNAQEGPYEIEATLDGPEGLFASIDGEIGRRLTQPKLSLKGAVPLGLANRLIAPNLVEGAAEFDMRLDGDLALSALAGRMSSRGARLSLPAAGLTLEGIDVTAMLSEARSDIVLNSSVTGGGVVSMNGQIALTAPYNANLTTGLNAINLSEPGFYDTSLNGSLSLQGPLESGAVVSGQIGLGPTEIRIPDGIVGGAQDMQGLIHIGEPSQVRQTRARAGLLTPPSGSNTAEFPLDLTISAPRQIFVRGRGLDAEFGGGLALGGHTNAVVGDGRFDLIRGRLDILGKRLELSEAYLQMAGDFDPFIRAVATTRSDDTDINITVEGLTSAPTVTISSSPDLPEEEVLAKLLFGRDLTKISPLQALQLANAVRMLSGRGGEGVIGRLRQNFGLDDLDVATREDGTAGVRAGKYISENAYTDVSVDTSGRTEINLNLELSPAVTLRGSAASDGDTGVGLFFERDY